MINYVPVTANTTLHTLVPTFKCDANNSMQGKFPLDFKVMASAKVWFQEKADIGKCIDMTDLEELTDDFINSQLLR